VCKFVEVVDLRLRKINFFFALTQNKPKIFQNYDITVGVVFLSRYRATRYSSLVVKRRDRLLTRETERKPGSLGWVYMFSLRLSSFKTNKQTTYFATLLLLLKILRIHLYIVEIYVLVHCGLLVTHGRPRIGPSKQYLTTFVQWLISYFLFSSSSYGS